MALNHSVHTGGMFDKDDWASGAISPILGGLIEVMSMNLRETYQYPVLMPEVLVALGDCSYFLGKQDSALEPRPKWMKDRQFKGDVDMISSNYCCVKCHAMFDVHLNLVDHVDEHHSFECNPCGINFGSYTELLAHSVTFCRAVKLNKICQLCTKTEHQCICLQSALKIYKAVGQWLDTRKKETIYDKYLFRHSPACSSLVLRFLS